MAFSIGLPAIFAVLALFVFLFPPQFAGLTFVTTSGVFNVNTAIKTLLPAFIASLFIERDAKTFVISLSKENCVVKESALNELKNDVVNMVEDAKPALFEQVHIS